MPKIKSNSGAAKRFKMTSSGKIKRAQSHRRHILTKKGTKRKRHLRSPLMVAPVDMAMIKRLIPYN